MSVVLVDELDEGDEYVRKYELACMIMEEESLAEAILLFHGFHMLTQEISTGKARLAAEAETPALLALCARLNAEATKDANALLAEQCDD
jgi:hypothetical protein